MFFFNFRSQQQDAAKVKQPKAEHEKCRVERNTTKDGVAILVTEILATVASEVSLDQKPMMKVSRPKTGQLTTGRTVGGTVFDGRGLDR